MKYTGFIFISLLTLILSSSCTEDSSLTGDADFLDSPSDIELIAAIDQTADVRGISLDELPPAAKSVIESYMTSSFVNYVRVARDFGYKVGLRSNQPDSMDQLNTLYFNKVGVRLKSDGRDDNAEGDNSEQSKSCATLVFPLKYIMPDGSTVSGKDSEELSKGLRSWYGAHPNSNERPKLQFPVRVIVKGTQIKVENADQLSRLFSSCDQTENDGSIEDSGSSSSDEIKDEHGLTASCINLVYPAALILPNGTKISSSNSDELKSVLQAWYKDHPESKEKPSILYPVEITIRDKKYTVNNAEEMRRYAAACDNDSGDRDGNGEDEGGSDEESGDRDGNG